ncbi:uncharacterized protein LOC132546873 [Ylistrum balloti]|uniref:uncharacterized protein LOC132546873 n=1 Tax=Ylistrum balloti TaxID=509963 RepID=UPI002905B2C4|nr:uncharacterized protein LOC132546873 [Ylistrum balloti]
MLGFHLIALLLTSYVRVSDQHGYLSWPPQRSSLWRHGHDSPINYNDNALWCGGLPYFTQVGEKCGTCGDSYYGPHEHEAGGKYALGIIGERYPLGTTEIKVTVTVNAYHKGFFEFKICPHNDPLSPVKQECLDQYPLKIQEAKKDKEGRKYYPPKGGVLDLTVEIPKGLQCSQCVLQWKYKTGNSWGKDLDGNSCLGCGPQEQFQNCADISIGYDAPPEEKTLGFTKRSVTGFTKSPGTVGPDIVMDANTNTLSPNGKYVVHKQTDATSAPSLPSPPPKVPDKIDISGLSLTGQLQQLLSRQTVSLTNPPMPTQIMARHTTNVPRKAERQKTPPKQIESNQRDIKQVKGSKQNKHSKNVPSKRRFEWKKVEVHRTKNTESLFTDHQRRGMVISAPGEAVMGLPEKAVISAPEEPITSAAGKSQQSANVIQSEYSIPTSVPSKLKSMNSNTRGNGVRRSRTKPVKMTKKERRRAAKEKRRAAKLAKKQRREAARLAKKARRIKTRTRSRQSRVKSSKAVIQQKQPVPSKVVKQHQALDTATHKLTSGSSKVNGLSSSSWKKVVNKLKKKLLNHSNKPGSEQAYTGLVTSLKYVVKNADRAAIDPDVLQSMKNLLNDVSKGSSNLV